ncbi:MAG: anti-sigma factor [Actinomycetota bacterium]
MSNHLGQRLSALIDGELGDVERDRVLVHLAGCEPCCQEASALRMLKRRMNSLGGAPADSDLTHRLMGLAAAATAFGDQFSLPDPGWLWPAAMPAGGTAAAREVRPGRVMVAGCFAFLLVGLGAAAFAAGGGDAQPGPQITPAVDVFMAQHEISTGAVPGVRDTLPSPAARFASPRVP